MPRKLILESLEDRRLLARTLTPNDVLPLANPVQIMESQFRDGPTETFQFSADAGTLFSASIQNPTSNVEGQATLVDPNGEEQFTVPLSSTPIGVPPKPTRFSFETTLAGVHEIRIDDHSATRFLPGQIELIQNARHESNDEKGTPSQAQPIDRSQGNSIQIVGRSTFTEKTDWFSFTLADGEFVSLTGAGEGANQPNFAVFAADGVTKLADSNLSEDRTKRLRIDSIVNFVDTTDNGVDDTYFVAIDSRYGLQLMFGYTDRPESLVSWGQGDQLSLYATAGNDVSIDIESLVPQSLEPFEITIANPSGEIASSSFVGNGTITFTPPTTAEYTVSLFQQFGRPTYGLRISGASPRTFHPILSGAHLGAYPDRTEISIEFTKSLRHQSGTAMIDGIEYPIQVAGRFARIELPEMEEGEHDLIIPANALIAADGDQWTGSQFQFSVDNTSPTGTLVDLRPDDVRPVGFNEFTVAFDEDIVVTDPTVSVSLSKSPGFEYVPSAWDFIDSRNIRILADLLDEGTYHLSVSRFRDTAGNQMEAISTPFVADGFTMKNGTKLRRNGLDGSLAAHSTPVGYLHDAEDKDAGYVELLVGQTVSLRYSVREAFGATTMTVRRDGQPIPILKLDTTSPNETVIERDFRVSESGPYILEFTGDGTAHYDAELIVNQLFAPVPRPMDRTTAMDLDDALVFSNHMISLRGNIDSTEDGSADWFKLGASPGELLSVVVSDIESSSVTLELFADSDTALATGSPNNVWNGAFLEHIIPAGDGPVEIFIRISGIAGPYTLTVAKNSRFEYLSSVGLRDGVQVIGSLGQPTPGKLFISSQVGIYETRPRLDGPWPVFNRIVPDSFRENDTGLAATPHSLLFVNGWGRIMEIDMSDGRLLREIPFRTTLAETSTSNLRALAYRDGKIYAMAPERLFVIDYATGATLNHFSLLIPKDENGIVFEDGLAFLGDQLYGGTFFGRLRPINHENGDFGETLFETRNAPMNDVDGLGSYDDMLVAVDEGVASPYIFTERGPFQTLDTRDPTEHQGIAGTGGFDSDGASHRTVLSAGTNYSIDFAIPAELPPALRSLYATLDVLDPAGAVVASGMLTPEDNLRLNFTANVDGEFNIQVDAIDGSYGEYTLQLNGQSELPPFAAAMIGAEFKQSLGHDFDTVIMSFTEPFDLASIAAEDIIVNGLPATDVRVLSPTTAAFTFAMATSGDYTLSLESGAILSSLGSPVGAYSTTFTIDNTPPTIVSTSLSESSLITTPTARFEFEFSEPTKPDQFSLRLYFEDVQLHPHPEFHFEVNGTTTVATVALPHDGEFELQTSGHNWLDAVGNRLDANGDGNAGGIRRIPFTARRGDANLDGLVDASDIDAICAALHANRTDHRFDMNGDSNVDRADITAIVEDVFETSFGDANLDGRFDSTDLVLIFQKAKYEDDIPNNATWTDGDWNCDGEFDTQDFVVAFQSGGYVRAARSFQSPGEAVPGIDYEARHARR